MRRELLYKEIKEFTEIAKRAFYLGLQSSTGGNISLKTQDNFIITKPSGKALIGCTFEDLIILDSQGHIIEGKEKPTKEIRLHLGIYNVRNDVRGIVHYHSPWTTAFAVQGVPVPLVTLHSKRILKRVPLIPDVKEGSLELARMVEKEFRDPQVLAVTVSKHGLIAVGPTLSFAQNIAELVEETAKTACFSLILEKVLN